MILVRVSLVLIVELLKIRLDYKGYFIKIFRKMQERKQGRTRREEFMLGAFFALVFISVYLFFTTCWWKTLGWFLG